MGDRKRSVGNHEADIQNPNKGTDGTNVSWDKAQGNRGKQLNPNRNQGYTSAKLAIEVDKKDLMTSPTSLAISDVSIIIPVKDNQLGIELFLKNFFETHTEANFPREIIIVDNGSQNTICIPKTYKNKLAIHLLKSREIGPANARNVGARKATGQWLLFTDSDCMPTNTFISGYRGSMNGSVGYAGAVNSMRIGRISNYYDSQKIFLPPSDHNSLSPQYLVTSNTLIWKEAFDKIAGFNSGFPLAGGEDIDLGLRLSKVGVLSYSLESVVLHDVGNNLIDFVKRFYRYGVGNKIIAYHHSINLTPQMFYPNIKNIINHVLSKIQYISLWFGFHSLKLKP